MNSTDLSTRAGDMAVPMGYAEKAMASLMQLHSELMEEKESRVDLYRRLMEKEQALAELKMYVKTLEEKVAAKKVVRSVPLPPAPIPRRKTASATLATPSIASSGPPQGPRLVVAPAPRSPGGAGWKTW